MSGRGSTWAVLVGGFLYAALPVSADPASQQSSSPETNVAYDGSALVHTSFGQMLHNHAAASVGREVQALRVLPPPPQAVRLAFDAGLLSSQPRVEGGALELTAGLPAAPSPLLSFTGVIDQGRVIPPDTQGAVGPTHVVEILNSGFTVFRRDGSQVAPEISLRAFWGSLGTTPGAPASTPFDPRIVFDQYSGRFIATAVSNPNGLDGTISSWVLLAISQTGDPTGGWTLFAVRVNVDVLTTQHFSDWADFPGLGVDPNNVVLSHNMFTLNANPAFIHTDIWVIEKAKLIAATGPLVLNVDYSRVHNPGNEFGFTLVPCHTFGQTPQTAVNYLLNEGYFDQATRLRRLFRLKRITGTGAAALLDNLGSANFIEVGCYSFCIADALQRDCDERINTIDTRLLQAVVRNGKIWIVHEVGATCQPAPLQGTGCGAGVPGMPSEVAWYELDPADFGPAPGGTPIQQGHVGDAALHFYYPSIAVNRDECVGLGFSGSDANRYVGGFYTSREPTDPPGEMRGPRQFVAGVAPYLKSDGLRNRWGDYSATVVDPVDDFTFWTVQEYAEIQFQPAEPDQCEPDQGRWGTHWAMWRCFQPGDCDGNDVVDLTDYSQFRECLGGPSVPPQCGCSDLDGDGDVDLGDYRLWANGFTGP